MFPLHSFFFYLWQHSKLEIQHHIIILRYISKFEVILSLKQQRHSSTRPTNQVADRNSNATWYSWDIIFNAAQTQEQWRILRDWLFITVRRQTFFRKDFRQQDKRSPFGKSYIRAQMARWLWLLHIMQVIIHSDQSVGCSVWNLEQGNTKKSTRLGLGLTNREQFQSSWVEPYHAMKMRL